MKEILESVTVKAASWFEQWFNEDYLLVYPHRNQSEADIQVNSGLKLLAELQLNAIKEALDLGCGSGRHAKALVAAGLNVVAIDLSAELLAQAADLSEGLLALARSDIRKLPFRDDSFDLLSSFFTSFGYFATDEEHLETLREWRRVLRREGALLLDLPDREATLARLEAHSERRLAGGEMIVEQRALSPDGMRIEKSITIHDEVRTRSYRESVRLFNELEICALLSEAGFTNAMRAADREGYLGRMLMVAR